MPALHFLPPGPAGYPKPALTNNSNPLSFYRSGRSELWTLGEKCDRWVVYEPRERTFDCRTIDIPAEIKRDFAPQRLSMDYDGEHDRVYVVSQPPQNGGNRLYVYRPEPGSWQTVFDFQDSFLPERLVRQGGLLSVFAYYHRKDGSETKVFILDPDDQSLKTAGLAVPNPSIRGFSILTDGEDSIYVYGGFDANAVCYNQMYRFGSAGMSLDSEIEVKLMTGRTFAYGTYLPKHGAVLFYGGTPDGHGAVNDGFVYFPARDEWRPLIDLPGLTDGTACCYDGEHDRMYLLCTHRFDPERREYLYTSAGLQYFDVGKIFEA